MSTVTLRKSRAEELELFCEMQKQPHARRFVLQNTLAQHRENFNNPDFTYLSMESEKSEVVGYFILVLEAENDSVEFGRIVVDQNAKGIGQLAIRKMEEYCKNVLKVGRIWLDVFVDNARGKHIYEKMGYRKFDEKELDGRTLLYYEKPLK